MIHKHNKKRKGQNLEENLQAVRIKKGLVAKEDPKAGKNQLLPHSQQITHHITSKVNPNKITNLKNRRIYLKLEV